MSVTTTTISEALKRVYREGDVANLIYPKNPLYAMIAKEGNFDGSYHAFAVKYRDSMGNSPTLATAQTSAQDATIGTFAPKQFLLTRIKSYQVYTLETEAILAAKRDKATFLNALTTEVDSALNHFGRTEAIAQYRSGSGSRGTISAATSTLLTLTNPGDVANFEVGMTIIGATSETAQSRNSGGGVVLTGVNRSAGTLAIATNPDSLAAGDYLFVKGERAAGASSGSITSADYLKMAGLEAWCPATAPTSTTFFNVDRSVDSSRLGGLRQDVSTFDPLEGIIYAANIAAREGASPSHYFMNFANLTDLQWALGAKAVTDYLKVGEIGFATIRINGPSGVINVVADQNCPENVGWLLDLPTWKLKYLGEMPNMLDLDGNTLSREASYDRFEGRMSFYGNTMCTAPGKNMRLVLP